jgi:hypothetical protein
MRLAILPITSFRHLKGESEVVMFTNQIRQWVHENEDVWCYLILPKDCQEQGWVGEIEGWPRCTVLWIDELGLYYLRQAHGDACLSNAGVQSTQRHVPDGSAGDVAACYGRRDAA